MSRLISILFSILIIFPINAQNENYLSDSDLNNAIILDSSNSRFPKISEIPVNYRDPILFTLSYFSELRNCNITFKSKRIRTTVNVRPSFGSLLFNSKSNRKYIVRINNSRKDSVITLNEVPVDALIGLFGHEFSHIVDYKSKSFWGVIHRAYSYLNKNKKEQFEKEIDLLAIQHDLGSFLYQWSAFVMFNSDASCKYKQFKKDIYLEPQEIESYCNGFNNDLNPIP